MKILQTLIILFAVMAGEAQSNMPLLAVSKNGRFFQTADGKPFFWLGDTGWLLFVKCSREEAVHYLDTRQQQGFNVIQVMLMHDLTKGTNVYGDSAFSGRDVSRPVLTPGKDPASSMEYDYWDHVDYIIDEAGKRNMYMALVPVWGSNVKDGRVSKEQASAYADFLGRRYRDRNNIIWLNGGDINGSDGLDAWNVIGAGLKKQDGRHLVTFHPRGRTSSSHWFHQEKWLDFNMFQSGHRSYEQDTLSEEPLHYGEDNWRYVQDDYKRNPVKPTIDGEPSYEDIPYGLHESTVPYWKDHEIRRYAYWSVFAGGCGFTYGHNSVMQFYVSGEKDASFFPTMDWKTGLSSPGAGQMKHLYTLLLSKSFFDRVPAQHLLVGNNGDKFDYLVATQGKGYAMVYSYTGKEFQVDLSKTGFAVRKAGWFDPVNGTTQYFDGFAKTGIVTFNPPGEPSKGNDRVLILE